MYRKYLTNVSTRSSVVKTSHESFCQPSFASFGTCKSARPRDGWVCFYPVAPQLLIHGIKNPYTQNLRISRSVCPAPISDHSSSLQHHFREEVGHRPHPKNIQSASRRTLKQGTSSQEIDGQSQSSDSLWCFLLHKSARTKPSRNSQ